MNIHPIMDNIDQKLLENLLEDTSFINWAKKKNQNDINYWNSWISNNESKIETIDLAKSIVIGINFNKTELPNDTVEKELNKVLTTIDATFAIKKHKQTKKNILSYIPYGIAAVLAIIFVVLVSNNNATITHETAFGEIINLTLPDGTSVVLNGNSFITYSKQNPRNVTLVGEAYFKVKPIPSTKAKFWVTTNDLKVEVYGTKFHVNTRDKKTDVVLDEGSIHLVLKNGVTKKINPGEFVSFSKETEKITHTKVSKKNPYKLWRNGTYIFNNQTLKTVMKNIESTYGLPIYFKEKNLEQIIISGGIPNQNIEICLKAIEKSAGIKLIKRNDSIVISTQ